MVEKFEIIVIGGGPGGIAAAKRAAQLGAKTALIEKKSLGGVCLHRGCIPAKYLLKNAREKVSQTRLSQIISDKDKIIAHLEQGLAEELKQAGVKVVFGEGEIRPDQEPAAVKPAGLAAGWKILVRRGPEAEELEAAKIILAAGSSPAQIAEVPLAGEIIISAEEALAPKIIPKNLLVVGGGAIGIEMATLYHGWGSRTTLLEMMPGLLPSLDKTITTKLETILRRQGIDILLGQKVDRLEVKGDVVGIILAGGEERTFDQVIVAAGRQLNSSQFAGLGLAVTKDKVKVDEYLKTNLPGIFAVGDLTGTALLAHSASYQGMIAAANAVAEKNNTPPTKADYRTMPFCVYSRPQAGGVGLTEQQARGQGLAIKIVQLSWRGLGRAVIDGAVEGVFKMISEEASGEILGIHILGQAVDNLLGEAVLIIKNKIKVEELRQTIHPHPSYCEIFWEAAQKLAG